jgi:hypothetical protein
MHLFGAVESHVVIVVAEERADVRKICSLLSLVLEGCSDQKDHQRRYHCDQEQFLNHPPSPFVRSYERRKNYESHLIRKSLEIKRHILLDYILPLRYSVLNLMIVVD